MNILLAFLPDSMLPLLIVGCGLALIVGLVKPRGVVQVVGMVVLSLIAAPFIAPMVESMIGALPIWILLLAVPLLLIWIVRKVLEPLLGRHATGHIIGAAIIGAAKLSYRAVALLIRIAARTVRAQLSERSK